MSSPDLIADRIAIVRGLRVILDTDLATLYGVETRRLNEQVRRNAGRFPAEFMFRVTNQEVAHLKSQIGTSNKGRGGTRKLPLAFTEHGALMAATILNSRRAIQMSVYVIRAFVQMRETLAAHKELSDRLNELEARLGRRLHGHDRAIGDILKAIRQLMTPPELPPRRGVGFLPSDQ
jgi:hypothetical protein